MSSVAADKPVYSTPRRYLTPSQCADEIATSKPSVIALIRSGELPAINTAVGEIPRYKILADDLEAFIRRRQVSS